jgi:uncharacterized protein involved in tolerance to divalent cations
MFQKNEDCSWGYYSKNYTVPNSMLVDFHDGKNPYIAYWEKIKDWKTRVMTALEDAQKDGKEVIYFTHGSSTSRRGRKTARSVVRTLMRSKITTCYVFKSKSTQYETFFVAVIRQKT